MAVLMFLKTFCYQVKICNNQKNFLVIIFGNANFDFPICCFGRNFWWILEKIACLFIYSIQMKQTFGNIYRACWVFSLLGQVVHSSSGLDSYSFMTKTLPLPRCLTLYKNLIAFPIKRADFWLKSSKSRS